MGSERGGQILYIEFSAAACKRAITICQYTFNGFRQPRKNVLTPPRMRGVGAILFGMNELFDLFERYVYVIWKMPTANRPADEDLRQMYAYNLQFGADEAYLVYPSNRGHCQTRGNYEPEQYQHTIHSHGCGLWFIDLFDEVEKLSSSIGDRMIAELAQESVANQL